MLTLIIRFCGSSWPFSKTRSLIGVWKPSWCSCIALFFWGPFCCFPLTASAVVLGVSSNCISKGIWTLPGKYHVNGHVLESSPILSHHLLFSTTFLITFAELWDQVRGQNSRWALTPSWAIHTAAVLCLRACNSDFLRSPNSWLNSRQRTLLPTFPLTSAEISGRLHTGIHLPQQVVQIVFLSHLP